ncbi:MAG: hypothetical protein GXP61_11130 [Epsilonproteobacteria bacterium]|nr:hypothetical protein [Campylobacterota bacterium]
MKNNELDLEIEELALQLTDMLSATLYFAGVQEEKLEEATEAYIDAIDVVLGDDDEAEMGVEEIISIVKYLKQTQPDLFFG